MSRQKKDYKNNGLNTELSQFFNKFETCLYNENISFDKTNEINYQTNHKSFK